MVARKLPALLAVPLMAIAMAAIAGNTPRRSRDVIAGGAVKLAPVYATVIFGALLSRVVLATGIAETIVTYAAEFGGDRPLVLALILCAAVALLFTSVTGLGAIIMIGTIVLPVMMTVGVPRVTAATLFLLAFGLGYILNIAQWKFYRQTFGVEQAQLQSYIFVLFAIDALVLIGFALVRARTTRDYATFAIAGDAAAQARASVGAADAGAAARALRRLSRRRAGRVSDRGAVRRARHAAARDRRDAERRVDPRRRRRRTGGDL